MSLHSQSVGLPKIKLSDRLYPGIPKKKVLKIKISCKFLPMILFKKFSDKILLDNNLIHPLKNKFSKNFYNSKQITFSKASSSSFSDYPCWSLVKYFDKVFVNFEKLKRQSFRKYIPHVTSK